MNHMPELWVVAWTRTHIIWFDDIVGQKSGSKDSKEDAAEDQHYLSHRLIVPYDKHSKRYIERNPCIACGKCNRKTVKKQ